ncbi:MAG TPA: hypothetical protein VNA11_13125 [Pseudonocardia sp.]|nr:hypothetical protein [Pseudonocardia sp.]
MLVALLGNLPWWGWVLLIVLGLVVGLVWTRRTSPGPPSATTRPRSE